MRPPGLKPSKYKPWGLWYCRSCERRWTGSAQAHCTGCHQHFSTVGNFDRHQRGLGENRTCVDPATVVDGQGRPVLKQVETSYGTTWVHVDPHRFFSEAKREAH